MSQRRNPGVVRSWIANTISSDIVISDALDSEIDFIGMGYSVTNGESREFWGFGGLELTANTTIQFINDNHNLSTNQEIENFIRAFKERTSSRRGRLGHWVTDSLEANTIYISMRAPFDSWWFLDDYDFSPWYGPKPTTPPSKAIDIPAANAMLLHSEESIFSGADTSNTEIQYYANGQAIEDDPTPAYTNLIKGCATGIKIGYDLNEERFNYIKLYPIDARPGEDQLPQRAFSIAANNNLTLIQTQICAGNIEDMPTEKEDTYSHVAAEAFHEKLDTSFDFINLYHDPVQKERVVVKIAVIQSSDPAPDIEYGMGFSYTEGPLNIPETISASASSDINNKYKLPEGSTWTPAPGLFDQGTYVQVANT